MCKILSLMICIYFISLNLEARDSSLKSSDWTGALSDNLGRKKALIRVHLSSIPLNSYYEIYQMKDVDITRGAIKDFFRKHILLEDPDDAKKHKTIEESLTGKLRLSWDVEDGTLRLLFYNAKYLSLFKGEPYLTLVVDKPVTGKIYSDEISAYLPDDIGESFIKSLGATRIYLTEFD